MATAFNPIADFSKMLESFNFPGVDKTSLIEARRKDLEALGEANRLAFEGMQAVVQKQAEMLSASVREIQAAAQKMTGGSPTDVMAKQGEFVQHSLKKAVDNMREIAEMAQKSQADALAAITRRAEQSIEEAKTLLPGT
jgi:phasin family protein